jgi:hypothetical protein
MQEAEKCESLDNVTIQTLTGHSWSMILVVVVVVVVVVVAEELSVLHAYLHSFLNAVLPHSAVL